ncbi:DUF4347 domain-containing protein [Noviherbaspirillum sp.]|uniref:DUF4347 domain-containing protein n=1 Tax=Noviherbaspirillum sp. TaxID=1926288 RepID=UPI002D3884E7|nr:DUF4347 domain-containing protein [Noviherbaspirillum sp.]HZW20313.1 DUF4347 domain-containing protein [Noviherbaspirillum sp.]
MPNTTNPSRHQVAFVDTRVDHYQVLLEELSKTMQVVVLDPTRDGLQQIAEWTGSHVGLDAVHIVSHGRPGAVQLGSIELSSATMMWESTQEALEQIGAAIQSNGQMLVYGCNTALGESGKQFLATLASITGVSAGASSDLTGSQTMGGDWNIEVVASPFTESGEFIGESSYDLAHVTNLSTYSGILSATESASGIVQVATGKDYLGGGTQTLTVLGTASLSDGKRVVLLVNTVAEYYGMPNYDNLQVALIETNGTVTRKILTGPVADRINYFNGTNHNHAEVQTNDHASIIALKNGGFVVTGGSNNGYGVQRYDNSGNVVTSGTPSGYHETTNPNTISYATTDGGYIVLWTTNNYVNLNFQRYDANGAAVGTAGGYNFGTSGTPAIWNSAVDEFGNLAVSYSTANVDTKSGVLLFNSSNTLVTNTAVAYYQVAASVSAKAGGGFALFGNDLFSGNGNTSSSYHVQYLGTNGTLSAVSQNVLPTTDYINKVQLLGNGDYFAYSGGHGWMVSGSSPSGATTRDIFSAADQTKFGGAIPYVNHDGTITATWIENKQSTSYGNLKEGIVSVVSYLAVTNAAPALGGVFETSASINDKSTIAPFAGVTYTDTDGTAFAVKITFSAANGTLSGTGLGGSAGNYTLTGSSAADLQSKLQALVFAPAANQTAPGNTVQTTFTLTPNDGATDGTANSSTKITVTSVNDTATATNLNQFKSFTEDPGSNVALDDIVVTDPDSGDTITATLTLSNPAAGSLTTGTYGSATSTYNAGTGVWTVTGSVANVNQALAAVALTPAANWDSDFTIATRIRDAANSGPADGSIAFTVTAVNDTPVINNFSGDASNFTPGTPEYIDAQPTIGDAATITDDNAHFDGGYLRITQTAGTTDGNFSFDASVVKAGVDEASADDVIAANEKVFVFDGLTWVEIGSVDGTEDGQNGNALKIGFNASALNGDVNSGEMSVGAGLLGYTQYTAPTIGARSFDLVLNDGGLSSSTASFSMKGIGVTGVTSNATNGKFKVGSTIDIQVTFNDVVNVDTTNGTPRLQLATGTTDQYATYYSGTGSATLTFRYTVQAGDTAADLDYTAITALDLNGGSIVDGATTPHTPALALAAPGGAGSLGANKAIVVDGLAPSDMALSAATVSTSASANTEVGTLSSTDGTAGDSFTYTLISGSGDTNNGAFTIFGNSLRATNPGNLTPGANTVRVRTTDAAGNTYEEALSITVTSNPTVTITSNKASVKAGETATVTFTFSETPSEFAAEDITVAGGTGSLTGLTVDGADNKIYRATFTPAADTQSVSASISVAAGTFKNASNQDNLVSNTLMINGDTVAPTVTSIERKTPSGEKTNADSLTYRVTFSEAVSNVSAADFIVSGTTATVSGVSSAGGNAYDVTVSGGDLASLDGTVVLAFAGGQDIADAAGNALASVTPTGTAETTYTVDNTVAAPVIALNADTGSSNSDRITKDGTVNVTLASDAASWEYSVNSGATWTTGTGSSFVLAAGAYSTGVVQVRQTDATGNISATVGNTSAITIDSSVAAPSLALASDTGSSAGDGITASGTVNVTLASDMAGWEYSTDSGGSWSAGSGTSFMLTAGAYATGSVKVRQTDVAGNVSSETGNAGALVIDTSNPTVSSTSRPALSQPSGTNSFTIAVTYADAGAGIDATTLGTGDITVTGPGAIGNLAVTGVSYDGTTKTATYTVAAPGSGWNAAAHAGAYTVGVNNGEVKDLAGNSVAANTSVHSFNVTFNATPDITSNGGLATANVSIAESTTAVTTVTATDADTNDVLTYSISGGADMARFTINAASGVLSFASAPLAASPTDTGADNVYDVEVMAADGNGGIAVQALAVTVLKDKDRDGTPDTSDTDIDGDGLLNSAEDPVPSAFPANPPGVIGDGNGDGVSDAEQIHVASIATPNASSSVASAKRFATLEVDGTQGYTITSVSNSATPATGLPRSVKMPLGVFDFTINNVAPGGTATVSLYVDKTLGFNGYYKQDNNGNWQKLGTVTTVGEKTKITFSLTDGGIYDADKTVNGVIVDPGGGVVVAPLIASNGGATTATVNVQEGTKTVTTVNAQAVGTVSYAITGGADQGKFAIDAATGALSFLAAPDYETPLDQGDSAANNTYVVEVTASDAHGSDVQTLTVKVGDVDETPPPPPTKSITVDGLTLQTGTTTNSDGSTTQTISIPVVTQTRNEEVGNNTVADIPLVKSGSGETVLTAQVPTGIGMEVKGSATAKPAGTSVTDLIREIKAHTDAGSADQNQLTGGGSGFLQSLPADAPLLVQTIVPTVAPNTGAPAEPLVIAGKPSTPGAELTALVVDTRGLPSGTTIQLHNVEFAAVIGAVRVTGGEGSQTVWGDGSAQYIVLGADDDVLHGGDGSDTVGSAGGNDRVFGDGGDDIVFGGIGQDLLAGGSGNDTATYAGKQADYRIERNGKIVTVRSIADADDADTLVNVETIQFADGNVSLADTYAPSSSVELIAGLYTAFYDRAPDLEGIRYWEAEASSKHLSHREISNLLAGHAKFDQLYAPSLSTADFVLKIYQNILGIDGDAAGRKYWAELIDSGVSRTAFVSDFVAAALNFDAATSTVTGTDLANAAMAKNTLSNKVDVGLHFAATLAEKSNGTVDSVAYQQSIDVLAAVSDSSASVEDAVVKIDVIGGHSGYGSVVAIENIFF